VGIATNVVYTINNIVPSGTSQGQAGGFGAAQYRSLPIFPVYWSDIPNASNPIPFNPYFNAYDAFAGTNIYLTQDKRNARLKREVFRNISNLSLDYKILPRLNYRAEVGLDYYSQVDFTYLSRYLRQSSINQNQPTAASTDYRTYFQNINLNQILSSERDLDENSKIDATLVQNYQRTANFSNSVTSEEFPNDQTTAVSSGLRQVGRSGNETAYSFISGMAIVKYGYKEKYFLQGSSRYEGSSRFAKGNKFGFFPAIGANWIISEEPRLKESKTISLLKVRGSFGRTGNAAGIGKLPVTDALSVFGKAICDLLINNHRL
jgi:hypothetical protein